MTFADITDGETAHNCANIQGALMHCYRLGPRVLMMLANQRVGRGVIEGFARSGGDAANKEECQQSSAHPSEHRAETEREQADHDDPFPRNAISEKSGYRHEHSIDESKARCDESKLHIRGLQPRLDQKQNSVEDLPVDLVQKIREPEKNEQFPFVACSRVEPGCR